jgi:pilus assembly protein CpaE
MTDFMQDSETMEVALLTINVDQVTVLNLSEIVAQMPWKIIQSDFNYYFSTDKRPYFNQKAIDAQACLAIIDFDKDLTLALETVAFLSGSFYHKIAIVALSSAAEPDLVLEAMRAGCNDFLEKPLDAATFTNTLHRLDKLWSAIVTHPLDAGKIISFFGAKGGVGTTALAVHLASFLAKDFKKKVLLIDNHRQLGHVALYLGLDGVHHTFQELVLSVNRLDSELLHGFVASYDDCTLDILSSPDVYEREAKSDSEAVEQTVEFLSTQYEFVILDCDANFEETNLAVIEHSHSVYLIATPEIGAIRDLSRYVDGLIQNKQATDKLHVLINRYSSRDAITTEQIEKAIRLPLALKISNDYLNILDAINGGVPILSSSKSDFSKEMLRWAASLVGRKEAAAQTPAKKLFAFF